MFGMPVPNFGAPVPLSGMGGESPSSLREQPISLPMPQIQPRGGMFGRKFGVGQAIVAALNGYLASRGNPVGMANMQMMQQMAQQRREEQQYEQRRQQALQDQMSLYDYKAAHPDMPDIQQRIAVLNGIKPGLGDTYAQNYANNGGGSMIQFVDPATGQRMMLPQPGQGMPAIGTVMDDPRKAAGAGGNASGNFP
jgi:hypothetical protein